MIGQSPKLIWPAITTAIMFAVMVGLGTWQVERLHWKQDLIREISIRMAADPVELPAGPIDAARWNYRRVRVAGVFRHDLEIHLKANGPDGAPGYHILTPLVRAAGPAVIVDRGWAPDRLREAASREAGQTAGEVTVSGIARAPLPRGWFIPDNDPAQNMWFHVTPEILAADLNRPLAAVIVDADATSNPGGWPLGGQTHLDIPNNHLQYIFTWYGLAATLAVVFVVYVRRARKA